MCANLHTYSGHSDICGVALTIERIKTKIRSGEKPGNRQNSVEIFLTMAVGPMKDFLYLNIERLFLDIENIIRITTSKRDS